MDKKGIVFGAGLSGLGAKELLKKNEYEVYLIDDKAAMPSEEGIRLLNEEEIEFVVKSPGIPWKAELLKVAKEKNVKVISEIDLAYKYVDKNIKIISFTGTNGKTTTSTKMAELLNFAGFCARLAGNAGFSFAKLVADEEELDYIVLELSSYQLENNPQIHSNIAGIINLTPDHLTRYNSVEDYYITKFAIFDKQTEDDFALINLDDEVFAGLYERSEIKQKIKAQKVYLSKEAKGTVFVYENNIRIMKDLSKRVDEIPNFDEKIDEISEILLKTEELSLKGRHNLENMLFLISSAKILNVKNEKIAEFLNRQLHWSIGLKTFL